MRRRSACRSESLEASNSPLKMSSDVSVDAAQSIHVVKVGVVKGVPCA
jgi:hypothetical protein